jgi:hypothetical protein
MEEQQEEVVAVALESEEVVAQEGEPAAGSGPGAGAATGAARGGEAYLKKLLAVAKRSLEDHKRRLVERDALVERQDRLVSELRDKHDKVVELAKRAQRRIEDLEIKLKAAQAAVAEQAEQAGHVDELSNAVPVAVLVRVGAGGKGGGVTWCLCVMRDPLGGAEAQRWLEEDEVYLRVGDHELPFLLPPVAEASEDASDALACEAALRAELAASEERLRKYRVRAELVRLQKEAEAAKLLEENQRLKQSGVTQGGYHVQAAAMAEEQARLTTAQLELERRIAVLKGQNAALVQDSRRVADDNARLQAELRAAQDQLEQQQQHEQQQGKARPRQLGEGEGGDDNTSASALKGRAVAAALLDQFSKLEREYDNYRAHAQRLFQDKDDAVVALEARLRQAQVGAADADAPVAPVPCADGQDDYSGDDADGAPARAEPTRRGSSGSVLSGDAGASAALGAAGGGSGPGGHHASRVAALKEQVRQQVVEREYVKNTLLRYLCAGPGPEREPMEAALATALQFTKDDVRRVQDSRSSLLAAQAGQSFTARWFGL